ncbi:MAG: MMPL family transporter, partial [Planctomycetota bacterium]|nr:MMPL family transporter [Planctomycetota bacterium]
GTIGFLKTRAVRQSGNFNGASRSIDRIRQLIADIKPQHQDVRIGLTGIPVLESDEMRRSQSDMIKASILSFFIVGVLLLFGFRGWKHPLLAMVMLAVGMCWTFGFTTLSIGHLNILSVSFAAILIGLGIDFAIHYLARYLELRHHGADLKQALSSSSAGVGVGIVTAAVTTSLAFFCASFTEFLGVAELGLIAGSGVLICTVATFLVLPALVTVADRGLEHEALPTPFEGGAFRSTIHRWPTTIAVLSLAIVAAIGSRGVVILDGRLQSVVGYDYNLLNLQADGLESVDIQRRIFNDSDGDRRFGKGSLLYAVSVARSASHARALRGEFLKLASVDHVEELATRFPEYPPEQTQLLVQGYNAQLTRLPKVLPPPPVVNPNLVGRMFEELLNRSGKMNQPQARQASESIDRLLNVLDPLELEQQLIVLSEYQQRLTESLLAQMTLLAESADPEPVTIKDLPRELASRFVSSDGRWLLQVYPKEPIWDIEPLRDFVNDVRTVDPEVTGTPLQNYEASQQIMQSYQYAAVYAFVVVTFVLLISFLGPEGALKTTLPSSIITGCIGIAQYSSNESLNWWILLGSFMSLMLSVSLVLNPRSVAFTLLALLPPVLGGLLSYGMLALFGISFNPANLILLPLILGIGVDDGVHVLHDFRTQSGDYRLSASTMNAIVLTSLTSMIGFGSMMIAAHRGLYSVGLVLVIGVGSCLFVSLVPLPAILTTVRRMTPRRLAAK